MMCGQSAEMSWRLVGAVRCFHDTGHRRDWLCISSSDAQHCLLKSLATIAILMEFGYTCDGIDSPAMMEVYFRHQ